VYLITDGCRDTISNIFIKTGVNLNRIKIEYVISFSDALFAFSITFMALSIQIPTFSSNMTDWELTRRLGQSLIPNLTHYVVSFMVVGMYWISYHRIFEHIRRADITLVFVALVGYLTGLLTTDTLSNTNLLQILLGSVTSRDQGLEKKEDHLA
jgi:uncharacterized membrane protein